MAQTLTYTVVFEQGENNWSAYVPDLPGCIAAADTYEEARLLIREAIEFHIEGLRTEGMTVPPPTTRADAVSVAA